MPRLQNPVPCHTANAMNDENPYHPPSGELLPPESPTRGGKRPKSQKWVLFIFGVTIAFRVYLFLRIPPLGIVGTAMYFHMLVPLVAMIFFRRAKATYYVSSASVLWMAIEGGRNALILQLGYWKLGWGMFVPQLLGTALMLWLFYKLIRHYVFGAVSRAYYGIAPIRTVQ